MPFSECRFITSPSDQSDGGTFLKAFENITVLTLNDVLLPWRNISNMLSSFSSLISFSASNNDFVTLDDVSLPLTLTELTLQQNQFRALSDIAALAQLTSLKKLNLRNNSISIVQRTFETSPLLSTPVFQSIVDLDISQNAISDWSFIDALATSFPAMTALRISQNPLYDVIGSDIEKRKALEDRLYLTIGRLAKLKVLNFSTIIAAERLNADLYYLSSIATELSLQSEEHAHIVITRHPRYAALCREYGEPTVNRQLGSESTSSLNSVLITLQLSLGPSTLSSVRSGISHSWTIELPKNLTLYNLLGIVARKFSLPPMKIHLVWETDDWTWAKTNSTESEWDSEDETTSRTVHAEAQKIFREVELNNATRTIASSVDGAFVRIRVELK
jgi:tubulin-specific chaperone E